VNFSSRLNTVYEKILDIGMPFARRLVVRTTKVLDLKGHLQSPTYCITNCGSENNIDYRGLASDTHRWLYDIKATYMYFRNKIIYLNYQSHKETPFCFRFQARNFLINIWKFFALYLKQKGVLLSD